MSKLSALLVLTTILSCGACRGRPQPAETGGATTIEVRPGHSFGPLELGMTREQVAATKLAIVADSSSPDVEYAGPYRLVFDQAGHVSRISLRLGAAREPIMFAGTPIPTAVASINDVAHVFHNCGAMEPRTGANVITCESGGIQLVEGGDEVRFVRIDVTPAGTR